MTNNTPTQQMQTLETQLNQNVQALDNPRLDPARVQALVETIDLNSSQSLINFGADAQKQLTQIADQMIGDVHADKAGKAGQLLGDMVGVLRGFQADALKADSKPSFFARLFQRAKPLALFLQRFDTVSEQIDKISNALEVQKQQLLVDITSLDKLYDANLAYFRALEHHIAAADNVLQKADNTTLPALQSKADSEADMESAQQLRDFRGRRDELDRRLHDLRLTRQVAMQALPSIRMIQENDKGLVNKINTTLINTVPLWRQQLAQSLAIYRSGEAAGILKASSDLTNDLLVSNAETLKIANQESRQQIERGVFDIDAVEKANQMLIATIEESLTIHAEARQKREEAQARLQQAENQLKQTLASAAVQQSSQNGGQA